MMQSDAPSDPSVYSIALHNYCVVIRTIHTLSFIRNKTKRYDNTP